MFQIKAAGLSYILENAGKVRSKYIYIYMEALPLGPFCCFLHITDTAETGSCFSVYYQQSED